MPRSYSTRAEATLQRNMAHFPELFPTRQHALAHLLFSFGTGMDWNRNGDLVDTLGHDTPASRRMQLRERARRAQEWQERWTERSGYYREWFQSMRECGKGDAVDKIIRKHRANRQRRARADRKRKLQNKSWFISQYNHIATMPLNASPDWINLGIEACEEFLADPHREERVDTPKVIALVEGWLTGLEGMQGN